MVCDVCVTRVTRQIKRFARVSHFAAAQVVKRGSVCNFSFSGGSYGERERERLGMRDIYYWNASMAGGSSGAVFVTTISRI